jgi:hypothetical protein
MLTKISGGKDLATTLTINSKTKSVIPGTSKWPVLRKTAALQRSSKNGFHVRLIRVNPVVVGATMVRKSGIAMATPRLIVDYVTVRLECLETGVDFDPLADRCWPLKDAGLLSSQTKKLRPSLEVDHSSN